VLPEHGGAVALLTNSQLGRRVYRALFPNLLRDAFGIEMAPEILPQNPSADLDTARSGRYRAGKAIATVEATADQLTIADHMGTTGTAHAVGDGSFVLDDPDADYPMVTFDGDMMGYFCSAWKRVATDPL